jgi:hypothetical protein
MAVVAACAGGIEISVHKKTAVKPVKNNTLFIVSSLELSL